MKTPLCLKTTQACYTKREHTCVLTPKRAAKAKNDIEGKVKANWEGESRIFTIEGSLDAHLVCWRGKQQTPLSSADLGVSCRRMSRRHWMGIRCANTGQCFDVTLQLRVLRKCFPNSVVWVRLSGLNLLFTSKWQRTDENTIKPRFCFHFLK